MALPVTLIKKIGVFRALQTGEMLCLIPAMRALRKAYPKAEITLIGLPWAATLLQRFPDYFDSFIPFPGLTEQSYDEAAWQCFKERMKEEQFDLLLQMHDAGIIVNPLMMQCKARYVAGFHITASYVKSPLFITYPAEGSEVKRLLKLLIHLGIAPQGSALEFPALPEDEAETDKLFLPVIKNRYIVVHPGGHGAWRQWSPHYFAFIADTCIEKGYTVLITGTSEEKDTTREVIKCMRHPAIDLTGQTSLGAIGCLIRNAFMLVANCTAVSQIAAATATPSIIIHMDGEPERWAPANRKIHHVIDWTRNPHPELVLHAVEKLFSQPIAVIA